MPSLNAWQHIYANVERDRSPGKTSGFQTLFYSQDGLSREDIHAIESRVFYVYDAARPVKRVFFQAPTGKIVLGQATATEDRDAAGRTGLYLAHSFTFEEAAFIQAGVSPMVLFRQLPFINTLDEAFARSDALTGHIDACTLHVDPSKAPPTTWPPDTRRALARFATEAERLKADRNAVALVGSPEAIERALDEALRFVPARLLPTVSFDTWFEKGGNLSFTYCWAAGFREAPRQPFYRVVDADRCEIDDTMRLEAPVTAYGQWVERRLQNEPGADLSAEKELADLVCRFLEEESIDETSLDRTPFALLQEVLAANEDSETLSAYRIGIVLLRAGAYEAFEHRLSRFDITERSALQVWCLTRSDIPERILQALEPSGRTNRPSPVQRLRDRLFGRK